jgi:hypothetical protein
MLDAKTIDMNFMLILWVFFLLIFRVFCVNSERLGDLVFFFNGRQWWWMTWVLRQRRWIITLFVRLFQFWNFVILSFFCFFFWVVWRLIKNMSLFFMMFMKKMKKNGGRRWIKAKKISFVGDSQLDIIDQQNLMRLILVQKIERLK